MRPKIISVLLILAAAMALAQSDSEIQSVIQKRIGRIPGVTVSVQSGAVTLSGTTSSLAQKQKTMNFARRTIGAKTVVDRLAVVPAVKQSDAQIIEAVKKTLAANLSRQESGAITAAVQDAVVTLTGTLPSSYPKHLAGVVTGLVPAIVNMNNRIVVKPLQPRPDTEILSDVTTRFAQNPLVPASDIAITVNAGVVTLSGTVNTFFQAEQAESVTRFVPGVIDVRNLLFVRG